MKERTPLDLAVQQNDLGAVQKLLDQGTTLEERNEALSDAAEFGRVATATLFTIVIRPPLKTSSASWKGKPY